jgi:hypothetical protein
MERSLSTRNPRKMRGCEAADRLESSVKKCHVISRVMEVTRDIRHLGSALREARNHSSGIGQLTARDSEVSASGPIAHCRA